MNRVFTIFGGTGDLTFRKLLPALYNMSLSGQLAAEDRILIIGRRDYSNAAYRALVQDWVNRFARLPYHEADFSRFASQIDYLRMDFTDPTQYAVLAERYHVLGDAAHIFYLAVAPRFFRVIAEGLSHIPAARAGKLVLEKPFGEDLTSAKALNRELEAIFGTERIYRIDHYLGKEMVRNIQTIRFSNPLFTDSWNARQIEFVQISALEDVGVETRGGYYDASGALKDMVQNHLFQLLSIVAMERPAHFSGADMHAEQLRVLRSLRPAGREPIADTLVLGQYDGYRAEPQVAPDSQTETYAALRLFVDNDRWRNMPFYIRTGKKAGKREMEVAVVFRSPAPGVPRNVLIIKIQPNEGVYLKFNIKKPGDTEEMAEAKMDFCQNCVLEYRINTPEAYERLLGACMRGERFWFAQWDQIEAGWDYIESLQALAAQDGAALYPYEPGMPGPAQADALLAQFGHHWYAPEDA